MPKIESQKQLVVAVGARESSDSGILVKSTTAFFCRQCLLPRFQMSLITLRTCAYIDPIIFGQHLFWDLDRLGAALWLDRNIRNKLMAARPP